MGSFSPNASESHWVLNPTHCHVAPANGYESHGSSGQEVSCFSSSSSFFPPLFFVAPGHAFLGGPFRGHVVLKGDIFCEAEPWGFGFWGFEHLMVFLESGGQRVGSLNQFNTIKLSLATVHPGGKSCLFLDARNDQGQRTECEICFWWGDVPCQS